ncbi:hypothetical protein GALL_517130 [mine drainage metagenome]|uniref:Uncharacterized protein n=1 Tax=mine drainage metagenome TaxID=410659 RepID=A0A1J5P683_9ZZZZ
MRAPLALGKNQLQQRRQPKCCAKQHRREHRES